MKPRYILLFTLAVISFFSLTAQVTLPIRQLDTTLMVGATPGNANVNGGGAATYSIPIFVSPGTAGLQPNISIEYNSQVANGVLGAGWNIAGLSAITRAPKDFYHDGIINGVDLQNDDQLEWDGNRITAYAGGNNGTEYATESASFAYIVSLSPGAMNGPNSFNITTKEGIKLAYGETADSRIEAPGTLKALLWRLNQMKDKNDNYINYSYIEQNGDSYIDKISYTGNTTTGLLPYNEIRFIYENRPDTSMYYIGGISISQTKRLDSIIVLSENVRVKQYAFNYSFISPEYNYYQKSTLTEIREFGSGNKTINPTVITWGTNNNIDPVPPSSVPLTNEITQSWFSDLNGDGRSDQFVLDKTYGSTSFTRWYYYQSDGTTLTKISSGNIPVSNCTDVSIADINNDGVNEILFKTQQTRTVIDCHPCGTPVTALIQTGTTAVTESDLNLAAGNSTTRLALTDSITMNVIQPGDPDTCCDTYYYTDYYAYAYSIVNGTLTRRNDIANIPLPELKAKILPGQINSDGSTDLLVLWADNNLAWGSVKGFTLTTCPNFNTPEKVELMDFDGDGLDEVFVLKAGAYTLYKYNETSQVFSVLTTGTAPAASSTNLKTGDFNGDGKKDIVIHNAGTFKFSVYLSTGIAFTAAVNTLKDPALDNPNLANTETDFYVFDLNGDGRDDILNFYSKLSSFPSDTGGLATKSHPMPYLNGSRAFVNYYSKYNGKLMLLGYRKLDDFLTDKEISLDFGDIDGDGVQDAALLVNPSHWPVTNSFNGMIYTNFANFQDYRVQNISNGLNQAAAFSYISLAAAGTGKYTKGKSSTFPLVDVQPAQFVVSTLTTHAGYMNAGNYVYSVTDFSYKGARSHLQGKGFLGFDTLVSVNNLSNTKTESCYGVNSPYYFRYPLAVNSYVANVAASKKTFTFTTASTGYKRYYTYPIKDISNDLVTGITVTHDYTFDNAGNMLTDKATFGSDAVVTTTNRYIAKGGSGVQNRISRSLVSSVYTSQPAFTTLTAFTYDTKGNCVSAIDSTVQAKPVTTTYGINTYGLPVSVTVSAAGIASRSSSTVYDSKYRMAIRTVNPLGYKSSRTYNFKYGVALSDSAANGLVTYYAYDEFGRLKNTTVPEGYTLSQSLAWPKATDPAGTIYSSSTVVPGKPTVKTYFDILGRGFRSETTAFNNKTLYTDLNFVPAMQYGKAGLLTSQTLPYYMGETPELIKYTYDAYGRSVEVNDQGIITKTSYSGKTVTTTKANNTSTKTINALGNVITATDNGGSIAYLYNSSGQPYQITAVGAKTTITYDACGRQLSLVDPDAGTTLYSYNPFGELASQTNANSFKDTLVYDALGRVTKRTLGGDSTTYVYNNTGTAIGQLASVTNGANGAKQEFNYDAFGRPITITQTIPGQAAKFITRHAYDKYGNDTSITYPETGFVVKNIYDSHGVLIKVTRADGTIIWQLNDVSSHGQVLKTTFGNNLSTNYSYYMDQVYQIKTGNVQNELYDFEVPNIGNILTRWDSLNSQYENFTYDNLDRLTGIKYKTQALQSISYAGNGNITSKYNGGTYTYDATKVHAVKTVSQPTGSTTPQSLQDITYTKFNKANLITQKTPVTQKTLTYAITYGPDEQRVKTVYTDTVNAVTTRYYAGSFEKEVSGTTTKQIHYINATTGLVGVYIKWDFEKSRSKDTLYYVCTDRQGSITALLKPSDTIAEKYSYDAYGRRRNPANWTDYNVKAPRLIARGYTGHEMLDGFGLINMNGRMYDPVIGRVLSPDIAVQAPGYTQSYNRYSYCMNNPLKYTDPSGWSMMLSNGSVVGYDFNDWGVSNSANLSMPGSGGHWSDENRSVFGNYMLMSPGEFQSYYGVSRNDYFNVLAPNYKTALPRNSPNFPTMDRKGQTGFWVQSYGGIGKNDKKDDGSPIDGIVKVNIFMHVDPKFYGVDVRFISEDIPFNSYFAGAINTQKSTYDAYIRKGLNSIEGKLLMHEFGHSLQEKYGGSLWYNLGVVPASAYNINTLDEDTYNHSWTEIQANTMAYYYFHFPSFWDTNEYPINTNYISDELKSKLYLHKP